VTRPRRPQPRRKQNPLHGVTCIDYKDTALLRKFVSDRGKIRSRRVTVQQWGFHPECGHGFQAAAVRLPEVFS